MAKKSLIEIRKTDIRCRSNTSKNEGRSNDIGRTKFGIKHTSRVFKTYKRQRSLLEFDIPTTKIMTIGQRGPSGKPVRANKVKDNGPIVKSSTNVDFIDLDETFMSSTSNFDCLSSKTREIVHIDEEEIINTLKDGIVDEPEINCPICRMNLNNLEIYQREAHCEECFEKSLPSRNTEELTSQSNSTNTCAEIIDLDDEILVDNHIINDLDSGSEKVCAMEDDISITKVNHNATAEKIIQKIEKQNKNGSNGTKTKRKPKPRLPLPRFKILSFDNTLYKIVVDGFNYASHPDITKYFLSHFHSDHYIGLKKSWEQGIIYCSDVTAKLLENKFKIGSDRVEILPLNEKFWIEPYLSVITLDANHCPGAVVFLFQEWDKVKNDSVPPIRQVLHTGDFRSCTKLINDINLILKGSSIDEVYLDTTYLTPGYHFPLQNSVLDVTSDFAYKLTQEGKRILFKDSQRSIMNFVKKNNNFQYSQLFLVGTYSIGKEKLAISIAEKLKTKIFIPKDSSKFKIVSQYLDYFPTGMITNNIEKSNVHLVPLSILSSKETIETYVTSLHGRFENVVGFIPTGWTFTNRFGISLDQYDSVIKKIDHCLDILDDKKRDFYDNFNIKTIIEQYKKYSKFQIFKIPYSEHSSFKDLIEFGIKIKTDKYIATVNLDDMKKVNDMVAWFAAWDIIRKEGKGIEK